MSGVMVACRWAAVVPVLLPLMLPMYSTGAAGLTDKQMFEPMDMRYSRRPKAHPIALLDTSAGLLPGGTSWAPGAGDQ